MKDFATILNKPKSKVLILRREGSLGDAVLTCAYYSSLKQFNKNIEINVFCFHSAYEYCKKLKEIDHLYRIKIRKIRKHRCFIYFLFLGLLFRFKKMDLIIDDNPFDGLNWKMFIWLMGRNKIFTNTQGYPSVPARVKGVLAQLGIPYQKPNIEILPEAQKTVNKFLELNKISNFIVFNCFGSVMEKSFSPSTFKKMIEKIREKNKEIAIIFPYQLFLEKILTQYKTEDENIFFFLTRTPHEVFSLLADSRNKLLISPDTSFIHIAAALNKNTICVRKKNSYYPSCNELATEIVTNSENINDIDFNLFSQALDKYNI